ncbi:hypothetical protein DL766_004086 [Monosporascus sp. MC13-8B]|uniref:glutamate--tRNA ligase n=1 Tax=Monosporascus cannonballus TaxID=155416 RepID=A0ABY0H2T1_9PEZI|nr:hypothetical protein DL762_006315 [Monosporascus cannonballus]RYO87075.1 hypothetical protein DL763_006496 [Monosporascus cannonballus]RYP32165.1 hypothetical protein DL766_004086 [Monosporascus sp. MC13-8B]
MSRGACCVERGHFGLLMYAHPYGTNSQARTRFAPSPTGYLHIGSLRTALYNFLLAKATGGQFLLRLEDTDQTRIVPDAEKRLYEDLKWAGLDWDEGPDIGGPYGPYKQSERLSLYAKHAEQLIRNGRAYRCFCKPEDLDSMKAKSIQDGSPLLYNGTCSHIDPDESARRAANGEPHCVRFNCGYIPFVNDLVYGLYKKPGKEDDFIIIKRDGYPTYHFANVVDDHLMNITHVIRGAEWLVSTPRHVALYEALGWQSPEFAHVGLLVDKNRQKLSKRHGDIDISSWRDRGILPIALLNYVMLLGWSPGRGTGGQQDVMNMEDMISKFHLKFTKGDITVNNKDEFIQKSHMRKMMRDLDPDKFIHLFLPGLEAGIKRLENVRASHDPTNGAVSRKGSMMGPLVPMARPALDGDKTVTNEYVRKVLTLDRKSYKSPDTYLWRNLYLLWQVPESVYVESLKEEMSGPRGLFYRKIEDGAAGEPKDTPHQLSELVAMLREILLPIDDSDWTNEHIGERATPFIKSVFADSKTSSYHDWGYHLLRWVLAGLRPGPALLPTMEILGKEETMRRVEQAMDVAKRWEEAEG